jgi:DNA-binding SARP family transcriptional activator
LRPPDPPDAPSLRLLGQPAWRLGGGAWQLLTRKDAAMLARLALDGPQSRTALAAWLWPGVPLPRAHANLRQRLYRQRRQAASLVEEVGDGLRLMSALRCDIHPSGDEPASVLAGPLLAGLPDADDEVQGWLDQARLQWSARRLDLLAGLAARQQERGELAAALATTEGLLALDPLLEHGWRRLMRLHHQRGDRAAAVSTFERCERVLRDELGLRPSHETQALLAEVEALESAASPTARQLLPPSLLRPPRLVARQAELLHMAAAWQGGQGFVVLGEAGMGKSRLLQALAGVRPGVLHSSGRPGDALI